jgi:hypothetical protein
MNGRGRCFHIAAAVLASCCALAGGLPSAAADELNLSPALPSEGDAMTIGLDTVTPPAVAGLVELVGHEITLHVAVIPTSPRPPGGPEHLVFNLPYLPAGPYTVFVDDGINPAFAFVVRPRTATLDLAQRFQVSVADQQLGATPNAVRLSDAGGYFWFFSPTDIEITVKIVDGRVVNNHFWVFVASMTDTPLAITVIDTSPQGCQPGGTGAAACPSKTYATTTRTNQNFIDVNAF